MKEENKITKLKVKIEEPGNYGLGFIDGKISADKPTIIDWGNGTKTTLTTPITSSAQANSSTDYYAYYSESGEYVISIDGWYKHFRCYISYISKVGVTQISDVLTEIIQVSSLITNFSSTFENCRNLLSVPPGLFDKNISVADFICTFLGCSSLTSIPSGLFDENTDARSFYGTFENCSSLESIPSGLFNKNTKVTHFIRTFYGCSNLTSIPSGLFDKNTVAMNFQFVFFNCSNLTSIPPGLFGNTNVANFNYAFYNCQNLTGETPYILSSDGITKIKLWDRNKVNGFTKFIPSYRTFYGCTKLADYADIPDIWK